MKLKTLILLQCVLIIGYLRGTDGIRCLNRTPANQSSVENQRTVIRGITQLTLQFDYILSRVAVTETNILFAPINIVKTLATVMLGAGGDTEKELSRVLGMAVGKKLTYNIPELHRELGVVLTKVTNENPGIAFGSNIHIAGGVFIQKGIPVCKNYIQLAKDIYRTEILALDFYNDGNKAATVVNQWIANKTNNRITDLINPPVAQDTKALFVGALYFNGNWDHPFLSSGTRWQTFYLGSEGRNSKQSITIQMMVNTDNIPVYEDNSLGYKAIGLPYKNSEVMMFVILPNMNIHIRNLTRSLSYNDIENIVKKNTVKEMFYVIPKMKLESRTNLRDSLEKLGVHTLFNRKRADFSNLADGIYADEILHQVEMEIDEIGTTGSAATSTIINRGGYEIFRVDRPFAFFIYNMKVDIITFWGNIVKPTPFLTK